MISMKTVDNKKDRVLIEPKRRKDEPPVSNKIIITFTPFELDAALKAYELDKAGGRALDLSRLYHVGREEGGADLVGPALGAPAAVFLLERIIALGGRQIVTLSTCGSLQKDIHIGDIILAEDALSEEGTSAHYGLSGSVSRTDSGLIEKMESALLKKGYPFRKGRIWTTDAPFRETLEKVRLYRDRGILGVDMEISAMMTVSAFRGVSLVNLLVVSDELGDLKWKPGFSDESLSLTFKKAALLVREFLFWLPGEKDEI
jgi:nucleoside phosphorylase